jgi:vancomycin resistance protein YoaR
MFTTASARLDRSGDRLPDWIRVGGVAYQGKTEDELGSALTRRATEYLSQRRILVVTLPEGRRRMWTVSRFALGERVDVGATVRDAFASAQSESFWGRLKRRVVGGDPVEIAIRRGVRDDALRRYLERNVKPLVERPGRPARLSLHAGRPEIIPDQPGLGLNLDASIAAVRTNLLTSSDERVELPLESTTPSVTVAEALGIVGEVSRFETHYSERGNRRKNLELACSRINGTIIKPGGVFSYNTVVGPRVAEAGFRMAPVIVRGRMEPGMGGGICQVSSTVYNAALLAGLEVVSRSHHAFPVHYLPPGRDATVVYGAIDLKLRNPGDTAVGIIADGSDGRVVVRFFGTPKEGRQITIERTGIGSWSAPVKTVYDSSLPPGKTVVVDSGRAGHRVSVWRVIRENGRVVRRELLSRDVYRAFPRIIARGVAAKPSAPAPTMPGQERPGPNGATVAPQDRTL